MNNLPRDNIIDLFVGVDDLVKQLGCPLSGKGSKRGGRPASLTASEIITILIWNGITESCKTLKGVYRYIAREYSDCFPGLPAYQNFVWLVHANLACTNQILQFLLSHKGTLRFVDSTMLEVCRFERIDRHKVAKGLVQIGKNHQGWHYGFKLHASINKQGELAGVYFTPANSHDAQAMPNIIDSSAQLVVGDSHYGAGMMKKKFIMTSTQQRLLRARTKIEATFDYLKEHMHLVSSFPRSIKGYSVHYISTLLGCQMRKLLGVS